MESIRADVALREPHGFPAIAGERKSARELLVHQLRRCADRASLQAGLRALAQYVGASHYLLVRHDLSLNTDIDFVVASDWPFDMVRSLASSIGANHVRMSEFDRCCNLMQPSFSQLADDVAVPDGVSREYCAIAFNVGRVRMAFLLLFPEHIILSQSRLRDVGLLTGYLASICCRPAMRLERESDLTDREIECLYWIAEGKTSDEIAVILGISRNTINNYIASVMRKTATRTRSEAIAWAVRNNLV